MLNKPFTYKISNSKYIIEKRLGEGGFSQVYQAKKIISGKSGKQYAIKVFKVNNQCQLKIIKKEIALNKIITESQNPFFIKYIPSSINGTSFENGLETQKYNIIFELASKGDLFKYLSSGGTGFKDSICKILLYKILKALQALHKIGICHRDIKPHNIFLNGEQFEVKIGDFGLSALIMGKNGKILVKGIVGTKEYMAPEIFFEEKYDGEKVDIFSTGVLLFFLRKLKVPFASATFVENGSNYENLYYYIKEKDEKKYWEYIGIDGLSPEFKKLFFKMVAFDPKERPTIEEILKDDWMKEVTNLNEEEYKKYEEELIKELKSREKTNNEAKTFFQKKNL